MVCRPLSRTLHSRHLGACACTDSRIGLDTLGSVLSSEEAADAFRKYCVAALCVESLAFVEAVDDFRAYARSPEHADDEVVSQVCHGHCDHSRTL